MVIERYTRTPPDEAALAAAARARGALGEVAKLAPVRAVLEAGLRARF